MGNSPTNAPLQISTAPTYRPTQQPMQGIEVSQVTDINIEQSETEAENNSDQFITFVLILIGCCLCLCVLIIMTVIGCKMRKLDKQNTQRENVMINRIGMTNILQVEEEEEFAKDAGIMDEFDQNVDDEIVTKGNDEDCMPANPIMNSVSFVVSSDSVH